MAYGRAPAYGSLCVAAGCLLAVWSTAKLAAGPVASLRDASDVAVDPRSRSTYVLFAQDDGVFVERRGHTAMRIRQYQITGRFAFVSVLYIREGKVRFITTTMPRPTGLGGQFDWLAGIYSQENLTEHTLSLRGGFHSRPRRVPLELLTYDRQLAPHLTQRILNLLGRCMSRPTPPPHSEQLGPRPLKLWLRIHLRGAGDHQIAWSKSGNLVAFGEPAGDRVSVARGNGATVRTQEFNLRDALPGVADLRAHAVLKSIVIRNNQVLCGVETGSEARPQHWIVTIDGKRLRFTRAGPRRGYLVRTLQEY